jgi:hypothetical protein
VVAAVNRGCRFARGRGEVLQFIDDFWSQTTKTTDVCSKPGANILIRGTVVTFMKIRSKKGGVVVAAYCTATPFSREIKGSGSVPIENFDCYLRLISGNCGAMLLNS